MIKKKWIAVIISAVMAIAVVTALPWTATVQAESSTKIAMLTYSGGGEKYDSFAALNTALKKFENKTVEITMLSDWNAARDGMFDRVLSIPEKCKATLYMDGHVFNRNNSWDSGDDCYDGELIYMHEDASLTINGGSPYVEHKQVPVHTSTSKDGLATGRATFYGGLLCGGASDDGPGGIYMDSDCTLTLNDVTIAGCRANTGFWSSEDGDGGAIQLDGADQKIVMNNSRITGCLASDRGGAIYADYTSTLYTTDVFEMNNSSIDHNYSTNNGGGIYLDLDNTKVSGSGNSSISFNESGGHGGGIYINDEDISISGFTLEGNKAKKNGGAIYVNNTDIGLTNLKVKNNSAEFGGGFYLPKKKLSMGACEITGNKASKSGGGVYLGSDVKEEINVTGKTIVRGNSAGWGANFYMSDDDPEDNRVRFNLGSGSDVRVYYADTKSKDQIMVTEGKTGDKIKSPDCTRFMTSENKGYYFAFLPEASNRKIILKKGTQPEKAAPVKISAEKITSKGDPADDHDRDYVGHVGDGGNIGFGYDLYKYYFTHQKTDSATGDEDRNGAFYYSDALFYGENDSTPQYKYNEHLATTSLALAFSAMYTARSADKVGGNTYYNKHAAGRQFLADIGCDEQYIYVNDSNVRKPETDSIGVIIGKKNLQKYNSSNKLADTGDILIPVAVRGGGYEREWASNVTVGTAEQTKGRGKEHQGFSDAAEMVTKEVNQYLDKYDLRDDYEQGNVKFWVVGYSRAGATANLTSKRLVEQIERDCKGAKKSQVFGYTCEAPKGGTDEAEKESAEKYYCIHNMINTADVVPYVAPDNMGFKRYGVDHYIPGTAAGNVTATEKTVKRGGKNGVTKVTTRRDNTAMRTKGAKENDSECKSYNAQRNKMVKQLAMIDSQVLFDDYFHPMWIDMPGMEFTEVGSYDNTRVEDFLDDFIRFFMEGLEPDNLDHWSQAVCTRDRWLEPWGMNGKYYNPIQTALRDFMCLAFGKSSDEFGTFASRAMTIMDKIPVVLHSGVTQFQIYTDVIGDWHELDPASKDKWCTYFWDMLDDVGALDILSAEEKQQLKQDWPTTLGFLLHMVDGDYQYSNSSYNGNAKNATWMSGEKKTMMYLGTFVTFSSYIMSNHYPEVNLAWARTYDWYYSGEFEGNPGWTPGEKDEYVVSEPKSVDSPTAFIETEETIDGETHKVAKDLEKKGAGNVNSLTSGQRIYLDNDQIKGEAIYYDLCEMKSNGKEGDDFEYNQIYRGGIDLPLGTDEANKTYRLKAYAMSYGVASDKVIYDIEVSNDRHTVTVIDQDDNGVRRTKYSYGEGETATLAAGQPSDKYFTKWKVERIDENGNRVDVTDDLLEGDKKEAASTDFEMPEIDAEYSEGYALECTANYADRIRKIQSATFYQNAPEAGNTLEESATIFFDEDSSKVLDYPINWKYEYTDPQTQETWIGQTDSGVFYNDTVYTAIITMPENKAGGIVFLPADELDVDFFDLDPKNISISKSDADGSLTVQIRFDKTESGNLHPPVPSVTVKALDTNTGAYIEDAEITYSVKHEQGQASTVLMTASEITAEKFVKWDLKDTGITLAEGYKLTDKTIQATIPDDSPEMLVIDAQYIPVISEITVNLAQPAGGKPLQTEAAEGTADHPATMRVRIEKEYEVHPDFVNIEWYPNPSSGRAAYLNTYTASVTLNPKEDESGKYITVREAGAQGDYTRINAEYVFAEQPVVTVNGATARLNPDFNLVKYAFPMTKYRFDHFEELSDITDLKYGSGESAIRKRLPDFVVCVPTNGSTWRGKVSWEVVKDDPDADPRAPSTWTATGSVELPEAMENPDNIPMIVTVKAYVNGADLAEAPKASLDSGTYLSDQSATLTTNEKDGTIYYAVTGEKPPADEAEYAAWEKTLTWEKYEGQSIDINRADAAPDEDGIRMITLKAYTVKEDKRDSAICTYTYTFDNEIPVPTGKELTYNTKEQTGIPSSPFYTIESETEGWIIQDGKAVAVDAGTYSAKLHLTDPNYRWVLPKEDGESANAAENQTTTDDQIVSFVISPIPVSYASISGVEDKTITFDSETQQYIPVTQDPEITVEFSGKITTLVEGTDYDLSYENNDRPSTEDQKATVIIRGKGNYSATASLPFEISEGTETSHKVVVNNGSQTRNYRYYEGDVVTVLANPEPDKYFRNWTVKLLNKDGETEKEDIAETLLGESKDKVSASFTMPAQSDGLFADYPEGYSLVIAANCPDRIKAISASVTAPKAGAELPTRANASFDGSTAAAGQYSISWTYSYEQDGKTVIVPTAAEAYKDTVYTATIAIPQDQAGGVVFAPSESLTGSCDTGTVKSVSRNDADGSASIVIEFPKTGKSGGTVRPDVDISLTVMAKDMNISAEGYDGAAAAEYQVRQDDTITLTAPNVENEHFIGWNFGSSGIDPVDGYDETDKTIQAKVPARLSGNPLKIYAEYVPVIGEINISLRAPVANEVMQTAAEAGTLKVKISNQYEIDPDCIDVAWTPEPGAGGKAAYLTLYTATVSLRTYEDETGEYIMAKGPGDTGYDTKLAAKFRYADNLVAKVNGNIAACDDAANSVIYTFPRTEAEPIDTRHKVTVIDGAQTSVHQYEPGEAVTVVANTPSDKYFKKWTVSLLSSEGAVIKEDPELPGVGGESFDPKQQAASFTMPEVGTDFPEAYSLRFTAVYGDRIGTITTSPAAPKAGTSLDAKASVLFDGREEAAEYPISWTYSYEKDGEQVVVPASGEAYRDTVYTATIIMPQDKDSDILFAPNGSLSGICETGTVKSIERNDADGSAKLVIEFEKTGKTGPLRPDADIALTIRTYDLNKDAPITEIKEEIYVLQNTSIILTAPDVPNEQFVKWDFKDTGIAPEKGYGVKDKLIHVKIPSGISEDALEVFAQYQPVVNTISADVTAPVSGEAMQTAADDNTLKVTVEKQYTIDPAFVVIAWTPEPLTEDDVQKAATKTSYTAEIRISTKKDADGEYIMAKGPDDEGYATRLSAKFVYADNLQAFVNGESAVCDTEENCVSYTFPPTEGDPEPVIKTHQVTVDNGSGAEPRECTYKENETVTAVANPSADRYFQNWSVKLLDAAGETVEEDIAEELLGDSINNATVKFNMPEEGQKIKSGLLGLFSPDGTYPEGYALQVTANCKNKITTVTTSPAAPEAGMNLAGTASVAFDGREEASEYPIKWTYSYEKDGKTITESASGKAYRNTVYTATITMPQDRAKDILFASSESLRGICATGTVRSVSRNDSDGSARIVIEFAPTESDQGPIRPDVPILLTVKTKDLNTGTYDESGSVTRQVQRNADQDTIITLKAPDLADEQFQTWDFGTTAITPAAGYTLSDSTLQAVIPKAVSESADALEIEAQYIPVVSEITAKLDAPVGGQAMQTSARADTLKVKISDTYEVNPACVRIAWSPAVSEGGSAAYLTTYTATLTIQPEEGRDSVEVRKVGENEYIPMQMNFVYAEIVKATVNGAPAVCNREKNSLSYTFPMTDDGGDSKHTVTVHDGEKDTVEKYQEGEPVTIMAFPSAEQYFRNWSVMLLSESGTEVADVTDTLLEDSASKSIARFVMPEAEMDEYGDELTYPAGYALEITANYGNKIKKITTAPDAPEAGREIWPRTSASFDDSTTATGPYSVTWTYTYEKDGRTIVVPAAGEAYRDTAYRATIDIPQSRVDDIVFADELTLALGYDEGVVVGSSVTKNDSDGSATIVIDFAKTAADVGPVRPDVPLELTINVMDLNLGTYDESEAEIYNLKRDGQDTIVTLTAPDVASEIFTTWDLGDIGLELAEGYALTDKTIQICIPNEVSQNFAGLAIEAQYIPIVNRISIVLDEPVAGQDLQTDADDTTLQVKILNQYQIDPEFIKISWSPDPEETEGHKKAADGTAYTATVSVEQKVDAYGPYIEAKGPEDTDYKRIAAQFTYADNLKATVNDKTAACDTESNSVSYTFSKTDSSHVVTVIDGNHSRSDKYKEGAQASIAANEPADKIFKNWSISLLDGDRKMVAEDIAESLLGVAVSDRSASFTIPEAGTPVTEDSAGQKYPNAYTLKCTANYIDRIKTVTVSPDAPMTGIELEENAYVSFDNGAPGVKCLISWTYVDKSGGDPIAVDANAKAAAETVYTATINVPMDPDNDIRFADSESLKGISETGTVKSITRNDADGSATIVIEFEKTGPPTSDKDVDNDIDLINKLPEPSAVTLNDKEAVENARKAYDALTDEQKAQIPDDLVKKLTDAEKMIEAWEAYTKQANDAKKIKVVLTSATAGKYKQAVVKWKKTAGVSGYQIRYSTNKKFKSGVKSVNVNKAGITKRNLKKLKVGATYYVQVRSFSNIKNQANGKTTVTYGTWSNTKKFVAMQKVKLTSAKPKKGKTALVKWKKCKSVTGYQIRYSTNKKFKKAKKVKVKKAKTTKKIIKKLKAGKTYYVQVRTFKKLKKKTVYGKWSKTRKFKAKK